MIAELAKEMPLVLLWQASQDAVMAPNLTATPTGTIARWTFVI